MDNVSIARYRNAPAAPRDVASLPDADTDAGTAGSSALPDTRASTGDDWITIIEPNFTGHRWRYVDWIAQACVEAGHRCLVVTDTEYASHPLAQRIVHEARPDLRLVLLDLHTVPLGPHFAMSVYMRFRNFYARALRQVSQTTRVRLVVAPYADYFFYTLGGLNSPFGKTPWIAIVMGMTFHHAGIGLRTPRRPLVDMAKSALFRRAMRARGLRTLFTIDPTLPGWFAGTRPKRAAPLNYVADPFPETHAADPQLARARLQLDAHARHLLVYGAIGERKGICELMLALAHRRDVPRLVIAGQQDDETRAFIDAHAPQLTPAPAIFDQFVPEEMERDLFSACDAVWLGYKQHYGMSGVLVQAYRFGKPVVASADGLIGWYCRDGALGPLLDDLEPATIARALDALAVRWRGDAVAAQPAGESLLSQNTLDQFKRTLQAAMI
ncbi:glycosyltransferase [Paraburkholderia lycopersici]|uniref:Glycosyltransferase involved in cell wall bisynthesis n=1 Tax=Paraburkholderia lycopersici TaxID=416944 RepID=A0A1G6GMY0_9BURK|nr:glycosyltransferase [Paraburkholderia lycopersici]SDB83314.1 Glycosyltransferase involved in cell wall bisynthesis [Paraburkholderia lycopersici]